MEFEEVIKANKKLKENIIKDMDNMDLNFNEEGGEAISIIKKILDKRFGF